MKVAVYRHHPWTPIGAGVLLTVGFSQSFRPFIALPRKRFAAAPAPNAETKIEHGEARLNPGFEQYPLTEGAVEVAEEGYTLPCKPGSYPRGGPPEEERTMNPNTTPGLLPGN